ncbi:MAG: hypothetical protein ABIH63_02255 [archaeon]
MKDRKGMQTVVAWVLLLGFSITLGTFVFIWATKSSEEMTESTLKFVEGGLQCDQVQIYAVFDPQDINNPCGYINITNRGYLTMEQIMVRGVNKATEQPIPNQKINMPLRPKEKFEGSTATWGLPQTNAEVELIPIIKDKTDMIACVDRIIRIEC